MPTTRRPLDRPRQRQLISAEALRLFVEIENTPKHKRGPKVYNDKERELARLLGLTSEWWNGNSVCDDSDGPGCPPHLARYENWFKVRAIREQLLEVCKAQPVPAK
jgi:hypothetical protein